MLRGETRRHCEVDSKSPQTSGIDAMETRDHGIPYLGVGLGLGLGMSRVRVTPKMDQFLTLNLRRVF